MKCMMNLRWVTVCECVAVVVVVVVSPLPALNMHARLLFAGRCQFMEVEMIKKKLQRIL